MVDRTLSSRYELKYWLPEQLAPEVRRHLRPFCRPDRYAEGRTGNRYTISSLYLDSPDFQLYRTTTEGHNNRFKLRIRAYSDQQETPVFFEIKKRQNQVVLKRRVMVERQIAARFLAGEPLPALDPKFEEFVTTARRLDARPVLRVRYEREAYESRSGDPARVTMDSAVSHVPTKTGNLALSGPAWEETPTEGLILEVKFTDNAPRWVAGMIRALGLERYSIPKYVLSLDRAFSVHGRRFWSGSAASKA